MQKLCCIPLNETPEIDVRLNCISTCCTKNGVNRKASLKKKDIVDGSNIKSEKQRCDDKEEEEDIVMKTCCCIFSRKTIHAKVLPVDDIPTNGSQSEGDLL